MSLIPSFFNSSFLEGGARENRKEDRIFGHSIINEPALNLSPNSSNSNAVSVSQIFGL